MRKFVYFGFIFLGFAKSAFAFGSSGFDSSNTNLPTINITGTGTFGTVVASSVSVNGPLNATTVSVSSLTVITFSGNDSTIVSAFSATNQGNVTLGGVGVGVLGQAVSTMTSVAPAGSHKIGVLALDSDVLNGTLNLVAMEGRTVAQGLAPQYLALLGFGDWRGLSPGTTSTIICLEGRLAITSDGTNATSTGTAAYQLYLNTPVGHAANDGQNNHTWAIFAPSTYPWYAAGNVGISSTTPQNQFVVKGPGGSQMSFGEPTPGIMGITFLNGPISLSNFQIAGSGNDLILNRPTGGALSITEGNVAASSFTATTGDFTTKGKITSLATADIGWHVVVQANQACNTTCTSACVFGEDTSVLGSFVDCTDATADRCLCAGNN